MEGTVAGDSCSWQRLVNQNLLRSKFKVNSNRVQRNRSGAEVDSEGSSSIEGTDLDVLCDSRRVMIADR